MACRFQIDALSCSAAGLRLLEVDEEVVERTTNSARLLLSEGAEHAVGTLEWPSLLKKLERERGSQLPNVARWTARPELGNCYVVTTIDADTKGSICRYH